MPSPQQQVTIGQMHRGHMPPLVRNLLLYLKLFLHVKLVCAAKVVRNGMLYLLLRVGGGYQVWLPGCPTEHKF